MTTPKKPKPPRNLQDSELKTAGHDDLLMWLWRFLDNGFADSYSLHPDRLVELTAEGRQRAVERLERLAGECRDAADPKGENSLHRALRESREGKVIVPAKLAAALRAKAAEIDAYVARLKLPKLSAEASQFVVVEKWLQAEIREGPFIGYEYLGSEPKGDLVGYMDAQAKLRLTGALHLLCYEQPQQQHLSIDAGEGKARQRDPKEVEHLTGLRLLDLPCWEIEHRFQRVWFDVRAVERTTGETIRELRWLKNLAGNRTWVYLVLAKASDALAGALDDQGFSLINRSELDPSTNNPS